MKSERKIVQKASYKIEVEAGKSYCICSCGYSNTQPFCDGAHVEHGFSPIWYQATETKIVGFCGCKYSEKMPLCDGKHKTL
ncbi:MAG: CDGSH iron-sulfur domain-containing protein [Alphaproteobacteria bacterium]|nr:CDGSH iron-sulfur domain-containing protein [Alphaproteobacteria bacterium]OJV14217.1 MAG: glutamate synthase [Alphaproteobacteria bacterium 33-17]